MAFLDYDGLKRFLAWLDARFVKTTAEDLTFEQIQAAVSAGIAAKRFPVGTQIMDTWTANDGTTSYSAPWDVVHHSDEGMSLCWHYALPEGIAYDAPEAIYYAPAGGLAAGTYCITIGAAYGTGWVKGESIQFTLEAAMDEGDQLYISCGSENVNPTAGRTWNVYAKGGATSKQSGTTSSGTAGTSLGTIGATNAHKTEGNLNAISRVVYGYGRWSESAIRQWLNSEAAGGQWWTAQNAWDRPPSQSSYRGFLAGCSEDFLSVLQPTDVVTALSTKEGFSEATETTQDRIFLPCLENWYIQPELADEGDEWDYYKTLAQEAGLTGKFQRWQTYEVLKKYAQNAQSTAYYTWFRTPQLSNACNAYCVNPNGYITVFSAPNQFRACPSCKILKK